MALAGLLVLDDKSTHAPGIGVLHGALDAGQKRAAPLGRARVWARGQAAGKAVGGNTGENIPSRDGGGIRTASVDKSATAEADNVQR